MRDFPGVVFVVDPSREHICVREAKALGIPVVAIVDTNSDPSGIDYVIPANDDAIRSVKLIVSAMADAVIEAREGVSPTKAKEDDEVVDIKSVLVQAAPTVEMAESAEESKDMKKKKPRKPKAKAQTEENKEEKKEDN